MTVTGIQPEKSAMANQASVASDSNQMKSLVVALALLGSSQASHALEAWDDTKVYANKAMIWKSISLTSLSFQSVFPKPIYGKSYFGILLTGATVVGAGAFSYFTAGAGAPVAATGVSTVARWAAGGGAGSYMAGLSTIGGWFGGNAMLGSAILNGISIGVTGSGAAYATLPTLSKIGVMASVTATTLDGVAVFQKPTTKNLKYQIRLMVPKNLGGKEVRLLTKQFYDIEEKINKPDSRNDQNAYRELAKKKEGMLKRAVTKGKSTLKSGGSNEDLMVLAILAKNAGHSDLFEKLLKKIPVEKMKDTGYLDYLKAVASTERDDTQTAKGLLEQSWRMNPYAVEQPLLLINIFGHKNFKKNENEILAIARKATKDFDSDKYGTGYSLVSLNYRLGTMYYNNEMYSQAQNFYEKANKEFSFLQRYLGDKSMQNTIRLGIANSMYAQNKKAEAQKLCEEVLADASDTDKSSIKSQCAEYN